MSSATQTKGLTESELKQFDEQGFLLKRGLVSPAMAAQISAECHALHEQMAAHTQPEVHVSWEVQKENRPKRIRQLMHSEKVSAGLNSVLRSDEVLDVVESILGPDVSLFHSKLLMKAAHDGTITPWHQDYAYWKQANNRPAYVNAMMAIDPATKENGAIQFVPGSHKQGLIPHDRRNEAFGVFLPGYFGDRKDAVLCEMQPGDIVFFGSLIIHGSDGNRSDKDRRANTVAYTVTGVDPKHCREVLRGKPLA
ncbi:MAG TPA: phytanoyl-CoA dioxygenase family protein [Planctomycetota bacterium]|nr:phytanoyl-CoA dioxygenase family protein [Planctomycetota bacterium]